MFIPVIAVLLMGGVVGVSLETNVPAVSNFGDKYLCATCVPGEEVSTKKK